MSWLILAGALPTAKAQFFGSPAATLMPQAFGLVARDLDGDGCLDLAASSPIANVVVVRAGNGAGGFGTPTVLPVGAGPYWLASADVNGDGRTDLITANSGAANASVLLAQNGGGYAAAQHVATAASPSCVAIGDLSADGIPDLAVATFSTQRLCVRLGNGSGAFPLAIDHALAAPIDHVTIADFTEDGRPDALVTQRYLGTIVLLPGIGRGKFAPPQSIPVGAGSPTMTMPVDMNGDGHLDVVVSSYRPTGAVSVLLGDGTGNFVAASAVTLGVFTHGLATGDIDRDGLPDVVVGDGLLGNGSFHVLRGAGNGQLTLTTSTPLPGGVVFFHFGDANSDGLPDLLCSSYSSNSVHLLPALP